jgi:hypothetical protein
VILAPAAERVLNRSRRTAAWTLRRATSRRRTPPGFILIGGQRYGTTSRYDYLTAHPAIAAAAKKEVHFFDLHYDRGVEWYRSHFPLRRDLDRLTERDAVPALTGDATPYYLFHRQAPERMRALLPDVNLIVLVRDPVERALSHDGLEVHDSFEPLSFSAAIEAESERVVTARGHLHHGYVARGRYEEQLEAWFADHPREQFLIHDSGELFDDSAGTVPRTLSFLGLPPHELEHSERLNVRSRANITPGLRRWLYEYFAPPNGKLVRPARHRLPLGGSGALSKD